MPLIKRVSVKFYLCLTWLIVACLLCASQGYAVEFGPRAQILHQKIRTAPQRSQSVEQTVKLIFAGPQQADFISRLKQQGFFPRVQLGVGRIDLAPSDLAELAGQEDVMIDLSKTFFPLLDQAAQNIGLTTTLRSNRSGNDVLLAVIDTGFDFNHPDLQHPDGSTRFVAFLDQRTQNAPLVCDASMINAGQCENSGGDFLTQTGHGTHVAAIAAGGDGVFRGIAPQALLLGVRSDFTEAGIIDALAWIDEQASQFGKPVVVNISLGSNEGPHDGTTALEQAIATFSEQPGRIVVAAAGNERQAVGYGIHIGGIVGPTEQRARFVGSGLQLEQYQIELWPNDNADIEFALTLEANIQADPNAITLSDQTPGWALANVTAPQVATLSQGGNTVANVTLAPQTNLDGDRGWLITVTAASGTLTNRYFQLVWQGVSGSFDAWLPDRVAKFLPLPAATHIVYPDATTVAANFVAGDSQKTITVPGSGQSVITATGYTTRNQWVDIDGAMQSESDIVGDLLDIASLGPTRDGRQKPDISVPGGWIASAIATNASFFSSTQRLDADHGVLRGTSMAAPIVTGIIALLLEGQPYLTFADVKQWIAGQAIQDEFTGPGNNSAWGAGKFSFAGATSTQLWQQDMAAVDQTAPEITLPANWLVVEDNAVTMIWQTSELASSALQNSQEQLKTIQSYRLAHQLTWPAPWPKKVRVVATDPQGNESKSQWLTLPGDRGCQVSTQTSVAPWLTWVVVLLVFIIQRRFMRAGRL